MAKLSLVLALGVLAAGFAARSSNTEHVMEIKQLIQQYEKALNASDTGAVLALYGKDPIFLPQNAPAMVGREAVRAAYDHVFANIRLAIAFEVHEVEQHGETAWARTTSAGRTTVLANGQVVTEGNNELFVFKREAGGWRIHRYLFATNQPARQ